MGLLIFWIVLAIVSASMAGSRGRSEAGWFILSLFIGVFAPIILLLIGKKSK